MTARPFHLPPLMKQHKHFLLLTAPVELHFGEDEALSVTYHAGLYGYPTVEARDRAKARANRADSTQKEVAFAVELLL